MAWDNDQETREILERALEDLCYETEIIEKKGHKNSGNL